MPIDSRSPPSEKRFEFMLSEKLHFQNEHGLQLAARLDLPADGEPMAYAVFAHCFTCSKNLTAVGHISRALTQAGFGVLRFDFTGLGESEGDFAHTHFASNVSDLVSAAQFLEAKYEAPRILIGHSLGGAAVLMAARQISSAEAVATIGAPCSPEHIRHLFVDDLDEISRKGEADVRLAGRVFTIRKQFIDDLERHNTPEAIRELDKALLILHAPLDQIVGIENAGRIFEHAKHPKSFISLDTADHLLTEPDDSRYAGSVIAAWSARYIPADRKRAKQGPPDENRIVAETGREGFRTEITANGHTLVADEPLSVGGTNMGPSPYDLLVAGLGACTSMTLRMYADRKELPLESVVVRLRHHKIHAEDCSHCEDKDVRIDHIEREIELRGSLDEDQRSRLLEIAERCPVHRTLESEIVIESSLKDLASSKSI